MSGKTELFMFLTAAFATFGGLVVGQEFFLSYQDILAVRAIDQAPESAELKATRSAEEAALQSGKMPIAEAKRALAERGRAGFAEIAPTASDDYSALSGWVHQRNFKPFVPPAPPPAPAVDPNAVPVDGAAVTDTSAAAVAPAGAQ